MTPRAYLREYDSRERDRAVEIPSAKPLKVERGDRIGVVLLHTGGPENAAQIRPFVYNAFLDPALFHLPGGPALRPLVCRILSTARGHGLRRFYESVGGGSPTRRVAEDQAARVGAALGEALPPEWGITARAYVSMRYSEPDALAAAQRMQRDGITKVVLLSGHPQYSKTTTGSAISWWRYLRQWGVVPRFPTACVRGYATHPKYVRAVSERIDEALQRFGRDVRADIPLLFSAFGTSERARAKRQDRYAERVRATVDEVMALRGHDRPHRAGFHGRIGPMKWLAPSSADELAGLSKLGHRNVVVVCIPGVTDSFETAHTLDIALRRRARQLGVCGFEVTRALNDHVLFIEALAEVAMDRLVPRVPCEVPRPAAEQRLVACASV